MTALDDFLDTYTASTRRIRLPGEDRNRVRHHVEALVEDVLFLRRIGNLDLPAAAERLGLPLATLEKALERNAPDLLAEFRALTELPLLPS